MKNKLNKIFKYILSRLSVLLELIELQRELVGIIKDISISQNRIEIKLNYLSDREKTDKREGALLNRIIENYLKKQLGLNIRSFLSDSDLQENFLNTYDLILECLDDNEKIVFVIITVYSKLSDQDVLKNLQNLTFIQNIDLKSIKLLFIVNSATDKARKVSEDAGAYILFSDRYFPKSPGLN